MNRRNQWHELGDLSSLIDFSSVSNYAQLYLPDLKQLSDLIETIIYASTPAFGLILISIFILGISRQKCFFLFALLISQSALLPFYSIHHVLNCLALPSILTIAWLSQIFDKLSANLKKTFLLATWILNFILASQQFPQYSQFEKSRVSQAVQLSKKGTPSLFIGKDNILSVQLHQSQLAAVALHRLMNPRHLEWLKKQIPTINWPQWNSNLYNSANDSQKLFSIFSQVKLLNPQLKIYLDSEESQLNHQHLRGLNHGVWNQFKAESSTPIMWLISANPMQNYSQTQTFKTGDSIALLWQTETPDLCFNISLVASSQQQIFTKTCSKGNRGSKIISIPDLTSGKYKIQLKNETQLASELYIHIKP